MENNIKKQDFLQSEEWRNFQASIGRKTFCVASEGSALSADKFQVSIIEHKLPIVGRYLYVPRGSENFSNEIFDLAKKEKVGWIRFDLKNKNSLDLIEKNTNCKIQKAPHDMQPREIFVLDISGSEEELLSRMSQKTRYNIRLAEKRGVKISVDRKYIDEFLRLVNVTARRKGISFHAENHYRQMLAIIPDNMLELYCAQYQGKIIAANLMVFYGDTAIYLHGATDDEYRNVMAPYLLQWQAILEAKEKGYRYYDFGGVSMNNDSKTNGWKGITKFKLGFSPKTKPIEFLGSYDIIINPVKYLLYRVIQKIKSYI